ncbi:unnamed protein product, partial [Coregonus sp. 'balchen']
KKKCRVRLGIGSRCPFPIPPKLTPSDASMVTVSVWKNREKKNVKNNHQLDSSFVSSFCLKPSTTSLTPLDPLSGRTPIGTPSPSPPGSPARSPSTLSKFFSLSSRSSLHIGSQTSSPFNASCVSLTVSTQSSSSATPPGPTCPSSPTHISSPAPRSSSPNPLDHHGETNKDSETARDLMSSEVKEVGAVVPQAKRVVPRITAIAEASIDLRASSVSLERPLVRSRDAMARLRNLFSKSSTQLGEQSCTGEVKDNTKLLGLPNIGNTCFMNSALQCLLGLPAFCRDILRQQDIWSSSPSSKLLSCFADLHQARLSGGTVKAKIKENKKILQTVKSCIFVGNEDDDEQGAHEFVVLLLFQLKEEGMALKAIHLPREAVRIQAEDYPYLHQPSALECACRDCSGSIASVTRHFLTLPRSDPPSPMWRDSLCPAWSQVGLHSVWGHWQAHWETTTWTTYLQTPQKAPLIDQRHQTDNIYKLSSVISHLGDNMYTGKMHVRMHGHNYEILMYTLFCLPCSPGHYISDVLDSRGSGWLCLDDSRVLRTDEATVLRARAQTAYILFYVCSEAGEGDQAPQDQEQHQENP